MVALCGVCKVQCNQDNGSIKCNGDCGRPFHINCIKEDSDRKITRSGNYWKCNDCKTPSVQSSLKSAASTELTKDFFIKMFENFKKEVFEELNKVRNDISDQAKSLQYMSDNLDANNKLISEVKEEFAILKKENEELRMKNTRLEQSVTDLQERIRMIEQYTRKNNIEISGIPETAREDVLKIVKDVGASISVEVREGEITAAHRVPSYRKDRTPSLVVQFQNKTIKDTWLEKFKAKKGLTAKEVNSVFAPNKVFINEHLSPENKLFLARIKEKCRDVGFKYVWCRDGKFYVRKKDGESAMRVNHVNDIAKIK
jgi:cell division protein FtsB